MASIAKPAAEEHNSVATAFLKDVQEHQDSGIAARYKRLGLSVRQGQKLKAKLLEKGQIEEYQEITPTGRLRTVRLTARGQEFLSGAQKCD